MVIGGILGVPPGVFCLCLGQALGIREKLPVSLFLFPPPFV